MIELISLISEINTEQSFEIDLHLDGNLFGILLAILFIGFFIFLFARNKYRIAKGDPRGLYTPAMSSQRKEPTQYINSPEVNESIKIKFNNYKIGSFVTEKDYYDCRCLMAPTMMINSNKNNNVYKPKSRFLKAFARSSRLYINDAFQAQTANGSYFNYADVLAYHINTGSKSEPSYTVMMNGAFITIPKKFSIDGSLFLRSAKNGCVFMRTGDMLDTDTEDVNFNKIFQAYTDSPETEFYMLTPNVMEKLVEVHNKTNGIIATIHPYGIYIALPLINLGSNVEEYSKIISELVDALSKT